MLALIAKRVSMSQTLLLKILIYHTKNKIIILVNKSVCFTENIVFFQHKSRSYFVYLRKNWEFFKKYFKTQPAF